MGRKGLARSRGAPATALVLDTGALLALEKGDARLRTLVTAARESGVRVLIPAGVLAQAWRGGARQALIASLLADDLTEVPPIDRAAAEAIGPLCAMRGTSDVVDAHIVLVALRERAKVLTSDPDDLRKLAPSLSIERI